MNFGKALEGIKNNEEWQRKGWNGKGMFIKLQNVDDFSKMQHNYVYMSDAQGKYFPWNPNNLDMLAEDWQRKEG